MTKPGTLLGRSLKLVIPAALAGLFLASGSAAAEGRGASDRTQVKVSLVAIPVTAGDKVWSTGAELRVPNPDSVMDAPETAATRWPAVVILHGSGGVDSRGGWYARKLNEAGFATLELDLWAARGVSGPSTRPKSPMETVPDAYAALALLSARPDIDPARIGVMGFSWGGVVTMLSATSAVQAKYAAPGQAFAAFAPLYPVCWAFNRVPGLEFKELTGKPVFIQAGELDRYDDPDSCAQLHAGLPAAAKAVVRVVTYPGATHAWDRREPDVVINDPFSHKGKGGPTPFTFNAAVTAKSTRDTLDFFLDTLSAKP